MRLSRMLLEVALDLDAEAEAIEAGHAADRRGFARMHPSEIEEALLHAADPVAATMPVQIINLSFGGARFHVDRALTAGSRAILELPGHALRLDGAILRTHGTEAAMIFDPASRADPHLSRILRSESLTHQIRT